MNAILHFDLPLVSQIFSVFAALANIKIDLSAVNITCDGSIAPISLVIDLVILGAVTLLIESDAQVFVAIGFNSLTSKFGQTIMLPSYREKVLPGGHWYNWFKYVRVCLYVLIVEIINGLNLPQVVLQFLMSFVEVEAFAQKEKAAHSSTPACDVLAGSPNIDSFLAYYSTAIAWLLIAPALYEIGRILYPRIPAIVKPYINEGMKTLEKVPDYKARELSEGRYLTDYLKAFYTLFAPDMWLAVAAHSWLYVIESLSPVYNKGNNNDFASPENQTAQQLACSPCINPCLGGPERDSTKVLYNQVVWHHENEYEIVLSTPDNTPPQTPSAVRTEYSKELKEALPSYYDFCRLELKELRDNFSESTSTKDVKVKDPFNFTLKRDENASCFVNFFKQFVAYFLLPFIVISGLGHIVTSIGRSVWITIAAMYGSFCLLALGVWTDDAVDAYDVQALVAGIGGKQNVKGSSSVKSTQDVKKSRDGYSLSLASDDETHQHQHSDFASAIAYLISTRAILLQVVPQLTVVSIFASYTSNYPIFVFTTKRKEDASGNDSLLNLKSVLPHLIIWNAWDIANKRGNPDKPYVYVPPGSSSLGAGTAPSAPVPPVASSTVTTATATSSAPTVPPTSPPPPPKVWILTSNVSREGQVTWKSNKGEIILDVLFKPKEKKIVLHWDDKKASNGLYEEKEFDMPGKEPWRATVTVTDTSFNISFRVGCWKDVEYKYKRGADCVQWSNFERVDITKAPDWKIANPGKASWTLYLLAPYIFVTESRLINYLLAIYQFCMSIGILYSPSTYGWMLSSAIVLLPYLFIKSLILCVYLGQGMGLQDADLWSTTNLSCDSSNDVLNTQNENQKSFETGQTQDGQTQAAAAVAGNSGGNSQI